MTETENPWFILDVRVKRGFFDSIENLTKYADWLNKKLNYKNMEDWYKITTQNLKDNYGSAIIKKYTIIKFLRTVYPNYKWLEWKFITTSMGFWKLLKNRKTFLEWLGQELKYETMEDWYNLTSLIITENGARGILAHHNGSIIQLIKCCYPQYDWLEWKFITTSMGFWNLLKNRKNFAIWLGKTLNYETMEDWYKITQNVIKINYGAGLLTQKYGCSNIKFLKDVFPEYKWLEWKFSIASQGFYQNLENHKIYVEWLGKTLKYETIEDWYKITSNIIKINDGAGLIEFYHGSIFTMLNKIFPHYEWLAWKFNNMPHNFWSDINNQKIYVGWLGKILNYKTMEHWYKIHQNDIINNYGSGVLSKYYGGSPNKLIQNIYPEYEWKPWLFNKTECNYWDKKENIKKFAIWLGKTLNYETMEDWYKITGNNIADNGATQLLHIYNSSPRRFVKDIFPEYKWINNKFKYKGYSRGQIVWLNFIQVLRKINIQHAENGGEYRILTTNYKADGYCEATNTIYEFHGDLWHGNPKIFNPEIISYFGKTYGELYQKTLEREEQIKDLGYNLVVMWEHDWKKINKSIITLQRKFRSLH